MNIRTIRKGFMYTTVFVTIVILRMAYRVTNIWNTPRYVITQSQDINDMTSLNKSVARTLKLPRNLTYPQIEQDKTITLDHGSGIFSCDMDRYIQVTKRQCRSILGEKSDSEILNNKQNRHYPLSSSDTKDGVESLAVDYVRYQGCDIDNVFQDCDKLRYSYMYGKDAVTEEEELFPLAFAMKIHKKENQAHRILRYIYQRHNLYCIHVDLKALEEFYLKFKLIGKCFHNIIVVEDRINVVYATIGLTDAELRCMEALIKTGHGWKYYINLAGQEFMLKTNLELVKILKNLNGTNDIMSHPVLSSELFRFKRKARIVDEKVFLTNETKQPFHRDVEMRKGSAYGMFSREFVEFVMTNKFVEKFYNWLNDTYMPEEFIWATLNNIPGVPGGPSRYIERKWFLSRSVKWKVDKTAKCGGKYVRDVCVYGTNDVPSLLRSRRVVANKFSDNYQPLALDCVENEMYSRLMAGHTSKLFDLENYRNYTADITDRQGVNEMN